MVTNLVPSNVLKAFPDVYGFVIKKERVERITLKGIEFNIKRYKTTMKTNGIRISLIDNSGQFFILFNEFLAGAESQRRADERAIGMFSFATLSNIDHDLEFIEGAGYYVYQNHIVFNEEDKSGTPMERLLQFAEYYKKKFNLRTFLKEEEFSDLDGLECDHD